jgi:vitamin B12/bleomycin/antimicrobial peptide transport system ATP-binding/permease protein
VAHEPHATPDQTRLTFRFWESASGFWRGHSAGRAWSLSGLLVAIVVLQLSVQYALNLWYRHFFDAFGRRDGTAVWTQVLVFVPIVAASIALAIFSVWTRMTTQRSWREWLSRYLIDHWLSDGHYKAPEYVAGERQSPEYRIAEDARLATEVPVDLAFGLLTALLTAAVFLDVLWRIGGALQIHLFGWNLSLPGYLVIAVLVYSASLTTAMVAVCRHMVRAVEGKNQAEAELKSMASRLRAAGDAGYHLRRKSVEIRGMRMVLNKVIHRWKDLSGQVMRFTLVSHANLLIAPAIAWILCAPNYLAGSMTLGEVAQASAAFVAVQTALNWVVGNYQNLAEWTASVNRVSVLLLSWDEVDAQHHAGPDLSDGRFASRLAAPAAGDDFRQD